jgi:hypothetical protein
MANIERIHRRVIQTLLRQPDKFLLLVLWIRAHHCYPSLPSRLDLQNKIEELLGEKL